MADRPRIRTTDRGNISEAFLQFPAVVFAIVVGDHAVRSSDTGESVQRVHLVLVALARTVVLFAIRGAVVTTEPIDENAEALARYPGDRSQAAMAEPPLPRSCAVRAKTAISS